MDEVAVVELDGSRPILVRGDGGWQYASDDRLCHGVGQVIGSDIHALYFDAGAGEVLLRRGAHACSAAPTTISLASLSNRTRSAVYEVRCPHSTDRVRLSFNVRTSLDRIVGLYDAMEEQADDFYAYLVAVLHSTSGYPVDLWTPGFRPVPSDRE